MRKADVIAKIAAQTGIHRIDIMIALDCFFDEVKTALVRKEPVHIRGFGSFFPKKKAAKTARNIKKNIKIELPERFAPAFKPAKEFSAAVKSVQIA